MERAGRWKISPMPAANGSSTMYSMESYSPPVKPTKLQARLKAQRPRYDNLVEIEPCCLEPLRAHTASSASSSPKTKTPPEQRAPPAKSALSLRKLLSEPNLKGLRKSRIKSLRTAPTIAQLPQKQHRQPSAKCKSKKLNTSAVKKKQQPQPQPQLQQQVVEKTPPPPALTAPKALTDVKRKYSINKKSKHKS